MQHHCLQSGDTHQCTLTSDLVVFQYHNARSCTHLNQLNYMHDIAAVTKNNANTIHC